MFGIGYLLGMLLLFFVPFFSERIGRIIAVRRTGKATECYFYGFCGLLISLVAVLGFCIGVCVSKLQEPVANIPINAMTLLAFGYMAFLKRFIQANVLQK